MDSVIERSLSAQNIKTCIRVHDGGFELDLC